MIYLDSNNVYLIKKFIEKTFFDPSSFSNKNDLLALKTTKVGNDDVKVKYNSDFLLLLQKNTNERLSTINNIENDFFTKEDYSSLTSIFEKYFLAISNYDSYSKKYNPIYNR
jgi:hypothetical protein